jgi:hypothetical protein
VASGDLGFASDHIKQIRPLWNYFRINRILDCDVGQPRLCLGSYKANSIFVELFRIFRNIDCDVGWPQLRLGSYKANSIFVELFQIYIILDCGVGRPPCWRNCCCCCWVNWWFLISIYYSSRNDVTDLKDMSFGINFGKVPKSGWKPVLTVTIEPQWL